MINKDEIGVFSVDELDELSEISDETLAQENKFIEDEIVPIARMMENLPCMCPPKAVDVGPVAKVLEGANVVEKSPDDVKVGEVVLTPIDTDDVPAPVYEYNAVVHSRDNEFLKTVAVIRHCPKCNHIQLAGDMEMVTKILGFGYMNVLDYETKDMKNDEEETSECGNCAHCEACESDIVEGQVELEEVVEDTEKKEECEG